MALTPWDALWLWIAPLPHTVKEQVDNAISHNLDGIIVYVDKKGRDPEFYSTGWKNRENKIPANPQALFKIASISKLYIAVAAAKLINCKRLSLDKTLADYLPELTGRIENANQITVRMMLQNRSGIPDFIDDPKLPWSDLPATPKEFLKLVLDKPADFMPDSRYSYSNTNYLLIGNILDKVLGNSHQQYIKKEILDKLKLTHTYSLLNEVNLRDVISGYYTEYHGDLKIQNFVVPGGSMVATAQDVGVFLRALNDGSLLNHDEQAIYSSIYVYEHTGLLPGYSSIARYYKDIDTVVIMFVNTSGGNSWTTLEVVYNRIVRILHKQSI
ncbi:serine hydrolase domain-containing protein [Sphingobacterium siyangense subsp. cladoniae]